MHLKVCVAGEFLYSIYEDAICAGLEQCGVSVSRFRMLTYNTLGPIGKLQYRWAIGPDISRLNENLIAHCRAELPDVLFLRNPIHITPQTYKTIQQQCGTKIVLYSNDNPYCDGRSVYWRNFLKGVSVVDAVCVYRPADELTVAGMGASRVYRLLPSYIKGVDDAPRIGRARKEVVFVGHFEQDSRVPALLKIHEAGIPIRVSGPGWEKRPKSLYALNCTPPLTGDDYKTAIGDAAASLVFLSERNRDVYTRRCFEIPVANGLMVAPRTKEMQELFAEGDECLMFGDPPELVEVLTQVLANPEEYSRVRHAGASRCIRDGHDHISRMRPLVEFFKTI